MAGPLIQRVRSPALVATHALLFEDSAQAAIDTLPEPLGEAAREGLVELVLRAGPARARVSALARLRTYGDVPWQAVFGVLLRDDAVTVRQAALDVAETLHHADWLAQALETVVRCDPSWQVRSRAVEQLSRWPEPFCWSLVSAADDPHWRVRHALVEIWSALDDSRARDEVLLRLERHVAESKKPARVRGVIAFLKYQWGMLAKLPHLPAEDPAKACSFWDWDDAVLARRLAQMSEADRRRQVAQMPVLLAHDSPRVHGPAAEALRRYAGTDELRRCLELLHDPRLGAAARVKGLMLRVDTDRLEAVQHYIGNTGDVDEPVLNSLIPSFSRAAALTPAAAEQLLQDPDQETSWHVLHQAARLCRVPLWNLAPQETPPLPEPVVRAAPVHQVVLGPVPDPRALGREGLVVSPLALSGHYGLPEAGFAQGVEAGINALFWEPNYATLTRFIRGISPALRSQLQLMAGTFEAEPRRIERDVERALGNLRIDCLSVFIVFWVRSAERLREDAREALVRLREAGKIRTFGLSTHDRPLALAALDDGWNPLMVRHSSAHPKAEEEVLPRAHQLGTSVISFSNTCYGRLVRAIAPEGLGAADCYRYSLMQPGVTMCLTAPATLEHLAENLSVLREPSLSAENVALLRQRAAELHERETVFRKLVYSL